jgi:mRNA interferase RelE/StbE
MAEVEYSDRAAEWLRGAEDDIAKRIVRKLNDISDFPDHYLLRLSNSRLYRLRVGDYRVIIDWRKNDGLLFVRRISKREGAYRS